jgi:glyoxylase-like metal-dependent hydrolase (beta-lactamase superfamily II)
MKITEEVFQVGGGGYTSFEDAAIYLIRLNDRAALVDGGCGRSQDRLLENIRACGTEPESIEYLLITHCHYDHIGGAKALKDALGCQAIAHELEAPFLEKGDNRVTAATWYGATLHPFPVDRKLSGTEEEILLGDRAIRAIHVPGHSPGSVVYLMESQGLQVLFGQDIHGPLDAELLSNRKDYRKSLERLISLKADILCEGHYGVFTGREEVERFIRSFL